MKTILGGKIVRILFSLVLCCALLLSLFPAPKPTPAMAADPFIVMLDPGHGGEDPGVVRPVNQPKYFEYLFNEKLVAACRAELETYDNVLVYVTRENNADITTYARSMYAKRVDADVFVSFHINSYSSASVGGAEIYVPCGNYRPQLAASARQLADKILANFSALELSGYGLTGDRLKNRGLKTRTAQDVRLQYEDGSAGDYYEVIRMGVRNNIPAMIIEHAYITNAADLKMLQDDEALKKLGQATAKAIAQQYNLKKTGNTLTQPKLQGQTSMVKISDLPLKYHYGSDGVTKVYDLNTGAEPFTLSASGGSGNGEYEFYSNNPAIIRIEGNKAYIVGAGDVRISVTKYEDGTYAPRSLPDINRLFLSVGSINTQLQIQVVDNYRAQGGQTVVLQCKPATGTHNGAVPSGTVTFYRNQTKIGTAKFDSNGICQMQAAGLQPGNYTFSVTYEAGKFDGFTIANSQPLSYFVEETSATPMSTPELTSTPEMPVLETPILSETSTPKQDGGFMDTLGSSPVLIILGVGILLVVVAIIVLIACRFRGRA